MDDLKNFSFYCKHCDHIVSIDFEMEIHSWRRKEARFTFKCTKCGFTEVFTEELERL